MSRAEANGVSYAIFNLEIYGIAAGMTMPGEPTQWWAPTEMGIALARYVSGETDTDPRD